MFRSLASSVITLFAVLLFAFTIVFIWNGSDGIEFKRVAMPNDKSTAVLLAEQYEKAKGNSKAMEVAAEEKKAEPVDAGSGNGPAVVFWVSIPGFRGDYIQKAETPFFDSMIAEGGATNKMRPSFPCLNFPAHATMATGVLPGKHGIPADSFRLKDGKTVEKPTDPSLLLAEPIWKTATRQGITTIVHDWPLSQNQTGENAAASFLKSFDPDLPDSKRLNAAFEAWEKAGGGDDAKKPRLIMVQLTDILKAGLKHGPRADETYAAVTAADKTLGEFITKVKAAWTKIAPKNGNLIVFVTTDHGMAELDKNVNIEQLLGANMMKHCDIIAHDAIANLYFKDLPASEGEKKIFKQKFDSEVGKAIYFRTHKKENLPPEWDYVSEGRVGDRVLVLKTGYAFTNMKGDEPVFKPADGPGLFGSYGYPVKESIRMSGQTILWGYPNPPATGSLDEISQLSFHATVCKMLGIKPAEGASTEALPVN